MLTSVRILVCLWDNYIISSNITTTGRLQYTYISRCLQWLDSWLSDRHIHFSLSLGFWEMRTGGQRWNGSRLSTSAEGLDSFDDPSLIALFALIFFLSHQMKLTTKNCSHKKWSFLFKGSTNWLTPFWTAEYWASLAQCWVPFFDLRVAPIVM